MKTIEEIKATVSVMKKQSLKANRSIGKAGFI
jgi:hypothetical protein